MAGADLGVLEGEVEKLAAFAGRGGRITVATVEEVLAGRRAGETAVFGWVDAVFLRRPDEALRGLGRLLDAGEEPLRLLALLARQLRLVWSARALADRGAGLAEIGEALVPRARFLAGKLLEQARGFDEGEFARLHEAMVEADLALKSSPASERFVLERLVLAVAAPRG
jgi:DNA polymerase-3 subunit delta